MKELSFIYHQDIKDKEREHSFTYWNKESDKYSFVYDRQILSDASIFETPVAITKVATGVSYSNLKELFAVNRKPFNPDWTEHFSFFNYNNSNYLDCSLFEYQDNNDLNIYSNKLLQKKQYEGNKLKPYMFGWIDVPSCVICKNRFGKEPIPDMLVYGLYFCQGRTKINNIYNSYLSKESILKHRIDNIYNKFIFGFNKTNDADMFDVKNAYNPIGHLNVYNDFSFCCKSDKIAELFKINNLWRSLRLGNIYRSFNIDKVNCPYDAVSNSDMYFFSRKEHCEDIFNGVNLFHAFSNSTLLFNNLYEMKKGNFDIDIDNVYLLHSSENQINMISDYFLYKDNEFLDIDKIRNIFINKTYNISLEKQIFMKGFMRDVHVLNDTFVYSSDRIKAIRLHDTDEFIFRMSSKAMAESQFEQNYFALKNSNNIFLQNQFHIYLDQKKTFKEYFDHTVYRNYVYNSDLSYYYGFIQKKRIGIVKNKMQETLYRNPVDIFIYQDNVDIYKSQYIIGLKDYMSIERNSRKDIDINVDELILRSPIYSDILNDINKRELGDIATIMIPISKKGSLTDIQYNILELSKKKLDSLLDDMMGVGSKISKPSFIDYEMNLMADKIATNTFMHYKKFQLIKSKIKGSMTNLGLIYIYKNTKEAQIDYDYHRVIKNEYQGFVINSSFVISKRQKFGFVIEDNFINKDRKEFNFNQYYSWILEQRKGMWYHEYGRDIQRKRIGILNNEEETWLIPTKNGMVINYTEAFINNFTRDIAKPEYNIVAITKNKIDLSQILITQDSIERAVKDLQLMENDSSHNWAWVYTEDDPFQTIHFGIDELLLPENDTRYSDFENLIFDKKTMSPINPVKIIDEKTFVAKYPIKHPIPDYESIGIEYIDVEVDLMQTIFLKFWQLWKQNVFKFGNMTMVQSVNQMLNYIYAWIISFISTEKLDQALRVFRLLRWFGETSIIQNSQYIVTYEQIDLTSNLHTGYCSIPNATNNMTVDGNLGVFKNTMTNIDSSVEFFVHNTEATTISFSLINTVGTTFVYLNDELIDSLTKSAQNLVYEIPYTGGQNIIRIEKPAMYNKNLEFYVGFITVKNGTAGDLTIKYDPSLRTGNKPINEIAQKIIEYANMYENSKEIYEQYKKGNLGVNALYKHMQTYWELHHECKEKGKRLTIKEI